MMMRKRFDRGSLHATWSYREVLGLVVAFGVSSLLWLIIILVALSFFPGW